MADPDGDSTYRVGSIDEVPEGSALTADADGTRVAVFRVGDEYYALNAVCPHQGGPLGDGKVEDGCVYCPWHGWQFDLETGEHVHGKGRTETYPVVVDGRDVYVEL